MKTPHTPAPWFVNLQGAIVSVNLEIVATTEQSNEQQANANLIAAAPEMLAALETIIFQLRDGKIFERDACITQARTAIAKAKGV